MNNEAERGRETGEVLIVRGTQRVLDRIGGVTASERDRSTTRLGDCYVNVLLWGPQAALFVSEVTLLPVLTAFAPATTLLAHLQAHSVPRSVAEPELAAMDSIGVAKTASRSVLGVMNEFKYLAEVHAKLDGETDLISLSLRLAVTPCGPLYTRHISPDRGLAALVAGG